MNRKYKIKLYGAKAFWCQVKRIEEGFRGLGHKIVDNSEEADFIYSNNPPYDIGDEEHKDFPLGSRDEVFKIFNVLDISANQTEESIKKLKSQLLKAHIVTCISDVTKKQLQGIGVKSVVINNPIKDVYCNTVQANKNIDFLYVGRANDPNKRFGLLERISKDYEIYVIGNEKPAFGSYVGPVNDLGLCQAYNEAKFVLLPSKFEGLGLTVLEAMAAGSIPIVCNDNPNSILCPDFCRVTPDPYAIYGRIKDLFKDYGRYRRLVLENYTYRIQHEFSKFTVAKNIINCYEDYFSKIYF